jgi:adenine-specific DNA methylase
VSSTGDSGRPDGPRLIETAFPLRQASLDSLHEKNVRHGHISTLHIWPARRPLAACRAALIASLLPAPADRHEQGRLVERLGGRVVQREGRNKTAGRTAQALREETRGGVLHWGRETSPDLDWFREEVRKAFGGRAPRVLDPFAGGGSIPLEAMRLGCEAIAMDINPVAWFILKCTLEYPHRLAGKTLSLPDFALASPESDLFPEPEADLAEHVRVWGAWVLERARADLERFYPVVDGRTTVAYLWARTVTCKNCRGEVPLLKTCWLCRKPRKKVVLELQAHPGEPRVSFGVRKLSDSEPDPHVETRGTMSRSGVRCPLCGVITTTEDLREEGRAGRLGERLVAVVVEGRRGKEYRPPTEAEVARAAEAASPEELARLAELLPHGLPAEPTPARSGKGAGRAFSVHAYGMRQWKDLFSPRQLLSLATFVRHTRAAREAMAELGYPPEWVEAVGGLLALAVDKLADYNAALSTWHVTGEKMRNVFTRFALPITWDFTELNPLSGSTGNYTACLEWVCRATEHTTAAARGRPAPRVLLGSATRLPLEPESVDLVLTDPPYYDAIPYSDTMDFFYVWLRRSLQGLSAEVDRAFSSELGPKWDHEAGDGELIDDDGRFGGDRQKSRAAYERGLLKAFRECYRVLTPEGRLVVVFAQKNPEAWEALVSAMVRAGFVVTASWPIQTEMGNRTRALSGAALSSSVWLVCRKRPPGTRPGWDRQVLEDMRVKLLGVRAGEGKGPPQKSALWEIWDAGIRGPDFIWAATGPALEVFSRHPVVRKADRPSELMTVGEFLGHVRRLVVDFVVGRMLSPDRGEAEGAALDDVTTYYLFHRQSFGFSDTPSGACILYAVSCGLSDRALVTDHDLLSRQARKTEPTKKDKAGNETSSGPTVRLKRWHERRGRRMGYENGGRPVPLIDQVHRLMHLWKAGDVTAVDDYVRERGLAGHRLFGQLLQALIELAENGNEERTLLESISNHLFDPRRTHPRYEQISASIDV